MNNHSVLKWFGAIIYSFIISLVGYWVWLIADMGAFKFVGNLFNEILTLIALGVLTSIIEFLATFWLYPLGYCLSPNKYNIRFHYLIIPTLIFLYFIGIVIYVVFWKIGGDAPLYFKIIVAGFNVNFYGKILYTFWKLYIEDFRQRHY